MEPKSVIQSEVNQKEKNKYRILMHVCGIQKNGTDEPICRTGIKIQTQGMDGVLGVGEGGMNWETGIDACALPCVKQTTSGHVLGGYCRELSSLLCNDPDGQDEGKVGRRYQREGTCAYIQLTHFVEQQKITMLYSNYTPFFKRIKQIRIGKKNRKTMKICHLSQHRWATRGL